MSLPRQSVLRGRMDGLERLLELLADGKWHKVDEILVTLGWNEKRARSILEFLSEHGLVSYRASEDSARIDSQLRSLMLES